MKKAMVFFVFALLALSMVSIAFAENDNSSNSGGDADSNETVEVNATSNETIEFIIEDEVESAAEEEAETVVPDGTVIARRENPRAEAMFCEKKGYVAVTRTDSTGKPYNVCVFPDGKECLQMEFMREKCGREYLEGLKEPSSQQIKEMMQDKIRNRECSDGCSIEVGGRNLVVKELSAERREIADKNIKARTALELSVEDVDDKTMLRALLSNGRWALVKYLPDSASEKAVEEMKAKCADRNCTVELKEVGLGEKAKLAYEVQTEKESRVLLLFKKKMKVISEIDAETGETISLKRPWWAFLAKETDETADDESETVVLASNLSA